MMTWKLPQRLIAQKSPEKRRKTGSSHVVFYNDTMQEKLNNEKTLEDLQVQALRNHEFEVYFQPKYNMKSGSVIGAEALVRWRSKEKGFMLPGDIYSLI
ncbi:MAG: EAL domain-containing protein [Flexilinea sp.]